MMKKDFDHIAKDYDIDFTYSEIGKCQRNSVYRYLNKSPKNLNILELNCGTGEDAIWLAKQGNQVLATDISDEMIKVAKQKGAEINNLKFETIDINKLSDLCESLVTFAVKSKFDLIFSNFGGLNCLSKKELKNFFHSASQLLHKNGKLILVIMPKNTLWERFYFILKIDFKKVFRRNTNKALEVNVENNPEVSGVKTWYYNPKDIKEIAKPYFKMVITKPIGFFIPPSYLENYFKKHKRLLRILDQLEKRIGKFGFLSRFSDHYLIELVFNRKERKEKS